MTPPKTLGSSSVDPSFSALPPARRRGSDSRLNFSSNELLHPAVKEVAEKIRVRMSAADLVHYPRNLDAAVRLAEYFRVGMEELLITPGSDSAIRLICAAYARRVGPRGLLIHPTPHYNGWEQSARLHGFAVHRVETDPATPSGLGPRLVEAARQSQGSALIAVSVPGAPVGGCLADGEIAELVRTTAARGHLLVLDACYQAFNGSLRAQLRWRGEQVLVVQSLSKSHGLAGARIAVVGAAADLITELGGGPLEQAVSGPTLLAAEVAIEHEELFRSVWAEIAGVRQRVARRLDEHGLPTVASSGNFLAVRVGDAAAAAGVARRLSDVGYRIRALSELSTLPGFAGYVRFTVANATATDRLTELLLTATAAAGPPTQGVGPTASEDEVTAAAANVETQAMPTKRR